MDELKELKAKLAAYEKEAQRGKDYQEINNIMGRYAWNNGGGNFGAVVDLFASDEYEPTGEIAWFGFAKGKKEIKQMWFDFQTYALKDRTGFLCNNYMCTPVVEIAEDGKTAQGCWFSPGFETMIEEWGPQGYWCYGKYGCDFIKEDGEWKLWHLHMYPIFRVHNDKTWACVSPTVEEYREDAFTDCPDLPRLGETTFMDEYSSDRIPLFWPQPPKAYTTFSETNSMTGAPTVEVIPEKINDKWLRAHGYESPYHFDD